MKFVWVNLVVTKYNAERRILHGSCKGAVTHMCAISKCGYLVQAKSHKAGSYIIAVCTCDIGGCVVVLVLLGENWRGDGGITL